ncbi:S-adenosylmethionine:tRNA ribosyltransferase-isomerase [Paenibacillus xylanexedens]|nr:S-adenosylmethionine:tRNA ribosyltransferase-isomerase [Paenibacillus xylanexedens]
MLRNLDLGKCRLVMLVSGLAGREEIMKGYEEGIGEEYRFLRFGDGMLMY